MTLPSPTDEHPDASPGGNDSVKEEAARYALLRRIGPALRHHMAGTLQPISMISAIMERRLQADPPDLASLRESSKSISSLSRSAGAASINLITWVAPKENGVVALQAGVDECVALLRTDLAFRGFNLVNDITANDNATTSVFALRTVLTAALLTLTDASTAPASVALSAVAEAGLTRVRIDVSSKDGLSGSDDIRSYRKLSWDDLSLLAAAEQVSLSHGADWVELTFSALERSDVRF